MPIQGSHVTLVSNGKAMDDDIIKALTDNKIVVLDGRNGDFCVSKIMMLEKLKDKTLIGVNGARLCSQWFITDSVRQALVDAGVPQMKTSARTGGVLSNGMRVSEEAEYNTRRMLMEIYGEDEPYREAGIMKWIGCENIVIRNIAFSGPGSIDVGGADLLSLSGCKHVWVDHCDFADGMDGNFDITSSSDFITVSWCRFRYTARSFMHQNCCLVGSNDREKRGFLNITYAYNYWTEGCRGRMPMARVGKIHLLCNLYDCTNNYSPCMNPRVDSEFLIEGNCIDARTTSFFTANSAKAWEWRKTNIIGNASLPVPESSGKVAVPYKYPKVRTKNLPEEIRRYVGNTLY